MFRSCSRDDLRQILYADRLESTIGTLLLIHDRDGHVRALDFHDFESRMRRLLRLHYGAEGNDFAVEDRAAPTTIRRAISDYFSGDLCAVDSIPVTTGGTSFQREVWAALMSFTKVGIRYVWRDSRSIRWRCGDHGV